MSINQHKIIGYYVIHYKITLQKPLQIASGLDGNSDKDLLLFYDNAKSIGKPYIPASSFVGSLQHFYQERAKKLFSDNFTNYIWGSSSEETEFISQSHFSPEDLCTFSEAKINIRDGVKINEETGTAEKGAKYDYEVLEPGIVFHGKAEIKLRYGIDNKDVERFIAFLQMALNSNYLRLGANKNNGFGHFKLYEFEAYHFDFLNKEANNANNYFNYLENLNRYIKRNQSYYECKPKIIETINLPEIVLEKTAVFRILANFKIKSTLIIGSDNFKDNLDSDSNKAHLQSNGKNILSGKSIRGVVKKRIKEINKVWTTDFKYKFNNDELAAFLGTGGDPEHKKRGVKSRLQIEECTIETAVKSFEQTRIKIDRFTGGTMKGALLQTSPLQTSKQTSDFSLEFNIIKASQKEKYILLLVLKDLWTGNLAIGGEKGIGRGILEGLKATVTNSNETFKLPEQSCNLNFLFND